MAAPGAGIPGAGREGAYGPGWPEAWMEALEVLRDEYERDG